MGFPVYAKARPHQGAALAATTPAASHRCVQRQPATRAAVSTATIQYRPVSLAVATSPSANPTDSQGRGADSLVAEDPGSARSAAAVTTPIATQVSPNGSVARNQSVGETARAQVASGDAQTETLGQVSAPSKPQTAREQATHRLHTMARAPRSPPETAAPARSTSCPNPIPHASNTSEACGIKVKKTHGNAGSAPVARPRWGTTKWYDSSSKKVGGVVAQSQANNQLKPVTMPAVVVATPRHANPARPGARSCRLRPDTKHPAVTRPAAGRIPASPLQYAKSESVATPLPMRIPNCVVETFRPVA